MSCSRPYSSPNSWWWTLRSVQDRAARSAPPPTAEATRGTTPNNQCKNLQRTLTYTYRDFALSLLSPVPWAIQPPLLGCRPCCKKTHLCKCKVCSASGLEVLALQPEQTVRLCGMHVITQAHPTCLGMRSSRGHVILVILRFHRKECSRWSSDSNPHRFTAAPTSKLIQWSCKATTLKAVVPVCNNNIDEHI